MKQFQHNECNYPGKIKQAEVQTSIQTGRLPFAWLKLVWSAYSAIIHGPVLLEGLYNIRATGQHKYLIINLFFSFCSNQTDYLLLRTIPLHLHNEISPARLWRLIIMKQLARKNVSHHTCICFCCWQSN